MSALLETAALWERYSEPLHRFILKRVADEPAASDILQDTFVKVHTRIGDLRDDRKLRSWLFQIARNAIIDHYRSQRPEVDLEEAVHVPLDAEDEETCDLRPAVARFTTALPDEYREPLLWDVQGMPQREIATRLGISLSGAKSRVQRAREKLKQALLDCCHYEFDRRGRVIDCRPAPPLGSECRMPCVFIARPPSIEMKLQAEENENDNFQHHFYRHDSRRSARPLRATRDRLR